MTSCAMERPPAPGTAPTAWSRTTATRFGRQRPGLALLVLTLSALGAWTFDSTAQAQGLGQGQGRSSADPTGRTISEVRIEGNRSIAEHQIRALMLSRAGRELDLDTVDADLRSLKRKNWFSHVSVTYQDDPVSSGSIILIYQVEEMPILTEVEYRGRTKISQKQLEENTGLKPGARADYLRNMAAVGQIRRLYQEKGYMMAEVHLLEGGQPEDRKVVFQIFEGPKFQVNSVKFEGNTVFTGPHLATKLSHGRRLLGLLPGRYDEEGPEEDARTLIETYQALGYFECQCEPVVRHTGKLGAVELVYVISEGPQYTVREIRFDGNDKLSEEELRDGLVMHSGEPLRDDVRQRDAITLRQKYSSIGCIDINILPEPRFTDTPGVVDLVYHIEEGDQYILGQIHVRGNERTRDKVIRRELLSAGLLPGEPLDGTRIEQAHQRLGALQYFHTSPEMGGEPIQIKITNRRSADEPYGEVAEIDLDEIIRARFQSPDDPPPIPPLLPPIEAPAPGLGTVPFGSGGAFERAPGELPAIPVPVPPPPGAFPPVRGRGGVPVVPPPNTTPPGTLPPLPGLNMHDVGPDLQEPFANRSPHNIATQVEPRRSYADLDVGVSEAPTGRILLGVGASSFGGFSGNLIIHERNFDILNIPRSPREVFNGQAFRGAGQEFRLELSPGTLVNRALVSFREPRLFDLEEPVGFSASGYSFQRVYPGFAFNEQRGGGRFSVGKQFGPQIYADVATRVEAVRLFDIRYPAPAELFAAQGNTFLTTIRPSIFFDNRNDPFLPSAGSYAEMAYEHGFGTFNFPKFTIEGRQHFTLGSRPDDTGKRILSLRGFFGIAGRDTPVYERFYAGDFRSMRGFQFRGVGPRVLGVNVGGILTTVGSIEYQFPVTPNDRLQLVVFSDFGTVENDYKFETFRAAVGAGVRVSVPALGPLPLAFDLAYPVAKAPGDETRLFTFFIGAFW
ncbi:hypothetical protein BH23PLA1_BH23PLA1_24400 [soil metagenome]